MYCRAVVKISFCVKVRFDELHCIFPCWLPWWWQPSARLPYTEKFVKNIHRRTSHPCQHWFSIIYRFAIVLKIIVPLKKCTTKDILMKLIFLTSNTKIGLPSIGGGGNPVKSLSVPSYLSRNTTHSIRVVLFLLFHYRSRWSFSFGFFRPLCL